MVVNCSTLQPLLHRYDPNGGYIRRKSFLAICHRVLSSCETMKLKHKLLAAVSKGMFRDGAEGENNSSTVKHEDK